MVSSRYFSEVRAAACLKLTPSCVVISVNVTGDGACGPGGGGAFGSSGLLYDRPARCGVGVGVGCWATTETELRRNPRTTIRNRQDAKVAKQNRSLHGRAIFATVVSGRSDLVLSSRKDGFFYLPMHLSLPYLTILEQNCRSTFQLARVDLFP